MSAPARPAPVGPAPGARADILSRVRAAQVRARLPASPSVRPEPAAAPDLSSSLPAADALKAGLLKELGLLGVEVHVEATEAAVRSRVKALVAGRSILSWDRERLPYGCGECLAGETACFGDAPRDLQAAAELGLTGCEAALADTGTLALTAGPGRPRTASLLPPVHLALVRLADILPGMGAYFARYGREDSLPYLVCVTGPSRTADIELSLTLGVHGPGKVIVVLGP